MRNLAISNPALALNFQELTQRKKRLWIFSSHLILWAVFLSIPTFFNSLRFGQGPSKYLWDLLEPPRFFNALYLVVLFYLNTRIIIPQLYFRHKYLLLAAYVLLTCVAFYIINYLVAPPEVVILPTFTPLGNSFNLFMFIIVYSFSFIYCLYRQYLKVNEDRLNTRISFLTAQVNPHFLFNTLNSIHSLSLIKSDKTSDAIVRLSGIMRYAFNEGSQITVELGKEIAYITSYVTLQKLRLTEETTVNLKVSNLDSNLWIVPFLLIPFVENAFKYGTNGEDESQIDIDIDINGRAIDMQVVNDIVPTRDREHSTGIGINTTRQRLQLLYPDRHMLTIKSEQNKFIVQLHLDLK